VQQTQTIVSLSCRYRTRLPVQASRRWLTLRASQLSRETGLADHTFANLSNFTLVRRRDTIDPILHIGSTRIVSMAIEIFKYFLIAWFVCIAIIVLRDILLTQNSLRGILSTNNDRQPNPERVPLLFFTIGFALYYSLTTLAQPIDDLPRIDDRPAMPDVPYEVLFILFGAQSSFIVGKIIRLYLGARTHV